MSDNLEKYKTTTAGVTQGNARPKRKSKKSNKNEIKENQSVVTNKTSITYEKEKRHLSVVDTNRGGSHSSTGDLDDSVFTGDTKSRLGSLASSVIKHKRNLSKKNESSVTLVTEEESFPLTNAIAESGPPSNVKPFLPSSTLSVISLLPKGVINIELLEEKVEYGSEMFAYLKEREAKFVLNSGYLEDGSTTSDMRAVLVDWLIQVQHYLKLSQQTLYISISILDTVLSLRDVETDKLQLVGISAVYLGSKMEEYYPADIKKLIHLTENSYIEEDVCNMEIVLLSVLQFQVYLPTPADFLTRIIIAALRSSSPDFHKCCYYLLDSHLPLSSHPTHPPSYLAAVSVFTVSLLYYTAANIETEESKLELDLLWTPTLEYYSGYQGKQVCRRNILINP